MKKIILLFFILPAKFSFCQLYTLTEKEIEVTSHFYNSFVLEMNGGKTVLLQMEPRIEGFLLKIYDPQHEQAISTKIKFDGIKDINNVYVSSFLELNKKAVLFYATFKNKAVSFYKLVIEPETGEQKNELLHSYQQTDAVSYFYTENCFLKIVEDQKHSKYAVICGSTTTNKDYAFNIITYNTLNDQVISKQERTFNDYYQLDLLDALMDNDDVYVCLNRKFKPKESETKGWFVLTEVSYIPQCKVSIMKFTLNSNLKEIAHIELPDFVYSTKAQFTLDPKNKQLNMVLSAINPADNYGKIPQTLNFFYKFSKRDLTINVKKEMTNNFAVNKAASLYPTLNIDKTTFANFPQQLFTDTAGNNTFLFQSVFNHYNQPDSYSDVMQKEFAFTYCNSETDANAITFSPYYFTLLGGLSGRLERFSFNNRATSSFMSPRLFASSSEYANYKPIKVGDKFVVILNMHPKNVGKTIPEKFVLNKDGDLMVPMILFANKGFYSFERIFNDPNYSKLRFNVNVSSFNENTKTFSVLATELNGKKERLVWLKFN
jgi:hypothetical protein